MSDRATASRIPIFLVEVDQDVCIGAGNCVGTAPAVFDQRDEDGIVVLLQTTPGAEEHDAVRKAVHLCPTKAIRIKESPA